WSPIGISPKQRDDWRSGPISWILEVRLATELSSRIDSEVERVRDEVVATRRDLHRHPELSHEERRTAGIAAERCEQLGMHVTSGVGGTGVVAGLDGGG